MRQVFCSHGERRRNERRRSMLWRGFFFSSRRRHTRFDCDWSSDVCSSDLCEILTIESLPYLIIMLLNAMNATTNPQAVRFLYRHKQDKLRRLDMWTAGSCFS